MNSPGTEDGSLRRRLDEVGIAHGTELSSLSRDHLRTWERLLAPLSGQSFDLLQIGLGTGASLRMWREWFPAARLVGLDARRLVLDPPIAECRIAQGNQTDLAVLQPLVRDHRFRLIVDDGSHDPNDKVETFLTLFPWLEPDSVYICAGLDESPAGSQDETRQPSQSVAAGTSARTGKRTARGPRLTRQHSERMEPETGVGWFAGLGRSLTEPAPRECTPREQPAREFILRKATSVVLLPGSAVVTS